MMMIKVDEAVEDMVEIKVVIRMIKAEVVDIKMTKVIMVDGVKLGIEMMMIKEDMVENMMIMVETKVIMEKTKVVMVETKVVMEENVMIKKMVINRYYKGGYKLLPL